MAFDDDLKNKGKNFANEHKDDAERMAREKLGGTNQRDSGDMGNGGGGTHMSDSDAAQGGMGRGTDTRMRDERDEQDYDEVA